MSLVVYDSLAGGKRPLTPLTPGHVRLYVCGPTVYDAAHVGHARVYVVFDVVARHLRASQRVTYVRNYTDIDDKIIRRAAAEGVGAGAVSERYIAAFEADMAALNCLPPDHTPRVTEYVPQVLALIEELVASGHAYAAGGDVYFAVERFAAYGRLAGRTLGDMAAGARVEVSEHKRHPMDFVLWKAAKPGEPAWPSAYGPGRPGWHIECSAMARALLGPRIDLHGGGRDLIFPHHENEIAQSEAGGAAPLAQAWLHNGLIHIDGVKMSKSLGNFTTVGALCARVHPQAVRLYLLSTHYRAPMQFGEAGLLEAELRAKYCYEALARLAAHAAADAGAPPPEGPLRAPSVATLGTRLAAALDDDFNTPQALAELAEAFPLINEMEASPGEAATDARTRIALRAALAQAAALLGLFGAAPAATLAELGRMRLRREGIDVARVEALVAARAAARAARDFAGGDAIRAELDAMGVALRDGPEGTVWEPRAGEPARR